MRRAIDLTATQRSVIDAIMTRFAGRFDRIAVYGSRVQGTARKGSDIDIVIFGKSDVRDVAALRQALEDSDLSIFAHVIVYDDITHAPLCEEIDRWAVDWPMVQKAPAKGNSE